MIRSMYAFALLLGAVFVGVQLQNDPGYVLVKLNQWTLESTFWVALLSLLFILFLLLCMLRLVDKLLRSPKLLLRWNQHRLAQKAQKITNKGLIEYSQGYWSKAKTHLIQALPNTENPLLNYLTAARAAQKMGDSTLRDHYLREAQISMPCAKIAVEMTQAQLQLDNHQWEQALATLKHLQSLMPEHPYVLKLLMNLYEELRDWKQLIVLLPDLKKVRVLPQHEFNTLRHKVYTQALIEQINLGEAVRVDDFFNKLPKDMRQDPEILTYYVRYLMQHQQDGNAEPLLRDALCREFNSSLIELYGLLSGDHAQLSFAQSFLKKYPHSEALYLSLGRVCFAQRLWGQAKHYLEHAQALHPSSSACYLLALLSEQCNEPNQAYQHMKQGLEMVIAQERAG